MARCRPQPCRPLPRTPAYPRLWGRTQRHARPSPEPLGDLTAPRPRRLFPPLTPTCSCQITTPPSRGCGPQPSLPTSALRCSDCTPPPPGPLCARQRPASTAAPVAPRYPWGAVPRSPPRLWSEGPHRRRPREAARATRLKEASLRWRLHTGDLAAAGLHRNHCSHSGSLACLAFRSLRAAPRLQEQGQQGSIAAAPIAARLRAETQGAPPRPPLHHRPVPLSTHHPGPPLLLRLLLRPPATTAAPLPSSSRPVAPRPPSWRPSQSRAPSRGPLPVHASPTPPGTTPCGAPAGRSCPPRAMPPLVASLQRGAPEESRKLRLRGRHGARLQQLWSALERQRRGDFRPRRPRLLQLRGALPILSSKRKRLRAKLPSRLHGALGRSLSAIMLLLKTVPSSNLTSDPDPACASHGGSSPDDRIDLACTLGSGSGCGGKGCLAQQGQTKNLGDIERHPNVI